jgi:Protein of unknown function (DUF1573)
MIIHKKTVQMKNLTLSITLAVLVSTLFAQDQLALTSNAATNVSVKIASFSWDETTVDFGKVKRNNPVTYEFTFTNAGNAPLVISSVKASCGCTVARYSKDPIPAGSTGFVSATYNAASLGVFTKTVTVTANTGQDPTVLIIKGEVTE